MADMTILLSQSRGLRGLRFPGDANTATVSITGAFRDKHHQRLEERSWRRPPSHHADECIMHKVAPDSTTSGITPVGDPIRTRRGVPATPAKLLHPLSKENPLSDQVMRNLLDVPSKIAPPASHRLLVGKHLRPMFMNGTRSRLATIKKPTTLINDFLKLNNRCSKGPRPPPQELPTHVLPRIIRDLRIPIKLRLLLFNDRAVQSSNAVSHLIEVHTARGKIDPLTKTRPSPHCFPNTAAVARASSPIQQAGPMQLLLNSPSWSISQLPLKDNSSSVSCILEQAQPLIGVVRINDSKKLREDSLATQRGMTPVLRGRESGRDAISRTGRWSLTLSCSVAMPITEATGDMSRSPAVAAAK